MRSFPLQVRRLTNLVELDLDHNRIGPSLPDSLWRIKVDIVISPFRHFVILGLSPLQTSCRVCQGSLAILGVAHNKLASVPPVIAALNLASTNHIPSRQLRFRIHLDLALANSHLFTRIHSISTPPLHTVQLFLQFCALKATAVRSKFALSFAQTQFHGLVSFI